MKPLPLIASSLALLSAVALAGCKKKDGPAASSTEPPPATNSGNTVDAAPPPPPPTDTAPSEETQAGTGDPLKDVCPQVLEKIQGCAEDKEFAAALQEGADAKQKKIIAGLIKEIADWPMGLCSNFAASYQYEGFIDHWDQLSDPAILETCAKLGAAVKAAGGLFGGDAAY